MGRPRRIIQTQYPYHITTRTNNKTFRFNKKQIINIFAEILNRAITKYNVKVFHFVLMANHYHMIIHTSDENLHRFQQYVNSRVAMKFNKREKKCGHLWGERYQSTILSTDNHYLRCIRYLYLNPVRAGEVVTPDLWSNSTFQFHAFGKAVKINVMEDNFFIVITGNKKDGNNYCESFSNLFSDLTDAEHELGLKLRKCFYGSVKFMKEMNLQYFRV